MRLFCYLLALSRFFLLCFWYNEGSPQTVFWRSYFLLLMIVGAAARGGIPVMGEFSLISWEAARFALSLAHGQGGVAVPRPLLF